MKELGDRDKFRFCFKSFYNCACGFQIQLLWLVRHLSVCVRRHHLAIILVQHLLGPVDTIAQVRLDVVLAAGP